MLAHNSKTQPITARKPGWEPEAASNTHIHPVTILRFFFIFFVVIWEKAFMWCQVWSWTKDLPTSSPWIPGFYVCTIIPQTPSCLLFCCCLFCGAGLHYADLADLGAIGRVMLRRINTRMLATQLAFFTLYNPDQPVTWCHPFSKWVFPHQLAQMRKIQCTNLHKLTGSRRSLVESLFSGLCQVNS